MSKRRVKHRRSKALVLMLLPSLIFIGFVGWLVSTLEPPNRKAAKHYQTPKAVRSRDDGVTFMPALYEETIEVKTY